MAFHAELTFKTQLLDIPGAASGFTHSRIQFYFLADNQAQVNTWLDNFLKHPCYNSGANTVIQRDVSDVGSPGRYSYYDPACRCYWQPHACSWKDIREFHDQPSRLDPWDYLKKETHDRTTH